MSGEKSTKTISVSSTAAATRTTTATATSIAIHPRRRITQNFLLIWLDTSMDQYNKDYQNMLTQLRSIVNEINIFTQPDPCIDFLTELNDMKAFLVLSGTIGQQVIPLIHDIPQLDVIYIFNGNKYTHEQWLKLKGVHNEITAICESLQQNVKQFNQDAISVSFLAVGEEASKQNLNQLDPTFMYTQLFKEILLNMGYNRQSMNDFTTYCRNGNYGSPNNITRFENEYHDKIAIWWYTFGSFIYSMLNCALRMLDVETIITMGFFISDLHHQIEQLYKKQVSNYHEKSFKVYRGQGLSKMDFENLLKTKGGLMSFNNFLSTSKDREVSVGFAEIALTKTGMVGVLFEMSIDPSVKWPPFASIQEVSYFNTEEEILFSMHTVFRIGEIKPMENEQSLYQVELTLTSDDDEELRILTDRIREEAGDGTGWNKLGNLLIKIGQFNKAEELYNVLLEQTSDESKKLHYYNQLGSVMCSQGDFEKAILYLEEAIEIQQKTLPSNHPDFATSYNNIAAVYHNMGKYSKALSFYEKSLEIRQKTLPPNHSDLATSNNNIGEVYRNTGEYSKAFSFYEKALDIRQKTLPSNHPRLATSYNNIGCMYYNMEEYSKALSFYEKSLEIRQKALPSNHPDLATSNNNIAAVYMNMGEYSKALSFYENSLEIYQKTLPPNHPDLATSYNNIGLVYKNMEEYSKALTFHEKALQIDQKTLSPDHPLLATSYNNIGLVYKNMEEYSKALSFYEKSLEIRQKVLPSNHPDFATSYNNIGLVYHNMGVYSKALSSFEKALEICQKTFPPNHSFLAIPYNSMGLVYKSMGEYSKALSFYDRALKIFQSLLPANHPNIKTVQGNIELLKQKM